MDFTWSAAQQELYERVRRFAREHLAAAPAEDATSRATFVESWRRAAAGGLAGAAVSQRYGGGGLDCLTTARALEGLGQECLDAGLSFAVAAHLLACCVPIDRHGSEAQKTRYLPDLCSGARIGANAISEPEAGSDTASLRTQARRMGDGYVLTGEKAFVTNAPVADLFVVYAATSRNRGLFNLSAFVVERDAPGVHIGPVVEKCGLTSALMASLRLTDCYVPASQRLGAEGAGAAIFHDAIGWERSCLFALWVGTMERQLAEVTAHASTRRQFGRAIGANQAVSHRIADMKLRLEAARLLLYRACWERAQGRPAESWAALAKIAISEAFVKSSLDAMQIFGGTGVARAAGIERRLRDAVPATIYSGTNEMLRELVARGLGLPGVAAVRADECDEPARATGA